MSAKTVSDEPARIAFPRQWVNLVVVYLLIPLILLICGWDLDWWQAWLYSLLIVIVGLGGAYVGGTATPRIVGRTTRR